VRVLARIEKKQVMRSGLQRGKGGEEDTETPHSQGLEAAAGWNT
jgi:hypothetical protein